METSAAQRLANLRDVAATATTIRPGLLLRSDAPRHGDDHADVGVLWPPATVIDLRDEPECDDVHSLAGLAEVIHAPIAGGLDENLDDLDAFNVTLLSGVRAQRLTATVAMIAASEAPVLVHCTGGKDRTGAVVALALALLGVERDVIIEDYALTEGNVEALKERIRVAGATNDYLAGIAPVGDAWRAKPQTITALLDAWEAHDGGVTAWFAENGGDADAVALLRSRLVR